MRQRKTFSLATLAAASLFVAACGGPSGDSSGDAGESGYADRSMKIGVLFEVKGEGSAGISDYANGAEIAINQINANGGVGGQPIETKRLPLDALDPQQASSDFLKMVDWEPDVIIGFPSSSIEAVTPQITRAQIPVLTAVQQEQVGYGGQFGSEYLWMVPPTSATYPMHAIDFLTDDLNKDEIAIIATDERFGQNTSELSEERLEQLDLKPKLNQLISTTATDLTSQVLQMKGADAAATWIYPNSLGVLARQLQQNGSSMPLISQGAMELAVNGGSVKPSEYPSELYSVLPCAPAAAEPNSKLGEFNEEYIQTYKEAPFSGGVLTYDGVYLAVAAAEQGESFAPDAINENLGSVEYSGACGEYKADGGHIMGHDISVVKFNKDGTSTVEKSVTSPPIDQGKN